MWRYRWWKWLAAGMGIVGVLYEYRWIYEQLEPRNCLPTAQRSAAVPL